MKSLKDIILELVKAHSQFNVNSIHNRKSSYRKDYDGKKMQDILGFDKDPGVESLDDTEKTMMDVVLDREAPEFSEIEEEKDEEE